MSEWIPFHRNLARGKKRGVPRALRFVLLELALEARPGSGTIDLVPEWDTATAVHDLIGGDRDEIEQALVAFMGGDDPTIISEHHDGKHVLIIPKWHEWAGPKSDKERAAAYRARKKASRPSRDRHVTRVTDERHGNVRGQSRVNSAIVTDGHDGGAIVTACKDTGSAPESSASSRNVTPRGEERILEEIRDTAKQPPTRLRGTRLPDGWTPTPESYQPTADEHHLTPAQVAAELASFRDYWRAKAGAGGVKLDWPATFRNWLRRSHQSNGGAPAARFDPKAALVQRDEGPPSWKMGKQIGKAP